MAFAEAKVVENYEESVEKAILAKRALCVNWVPKQECAFSSSFSETLVPACYNTNLRNNPSSCIIKHLLKDWIGNKRSERTPDRIKWWN